MTIIAPGNYVAILQSVEGGISSRKGTPFLRLRFITKEEIEERKIVDEQMLSTMKQITLVAYVVGSRENIIAWKRCVGQEFTLRVNHKQVDDQIYLDTRLVS